MSRHLHLTDFQLLVRCVHPWASDILRTWSTIARSVILCVHLQIVCISTCIIVHSLQVHRWWAYWQAQKTRVSKDESTEFMISKRVQRSTQWLVHGSPSGSIGLPEAVHQVVSKGAILAIHRESIVPTVEVVLSWRWVLSHAGRTRPYSLILWSLVISSQRTQLFLTPQNSHFFWPPPQGSDLNSF